MGGMVIDVRIKEGSDINKGDPIAILNAMKMVSPVRFQSRDFCRPKQN
jgi:biotin carboxyl carrier protein